VRVKLTSVPAQTAFDGFATIATVGVIPGFTVMGMVFETAVAGDAQTKLELTITDTWSPLDKVLLVKLGALFPVLIPLTCHCQEGLAPSLVAVAVNVTAAPAQIVVAGVAILTDGVTAAVIVTGTELDSAELVVRQFPPDTVMLA